MAKKENNEKRAAIIELLASKGVIIVTAESISGLSLEDLQKQTLSNQETIVDSLMVILDEVDQVVSDLKSELDSKETQIELKKPVIKIGTKKYQLNTPKFRHNNNIVDQKELESNPELAKEILEIEGQNILEELK